jgi:Zn-dependent alcohol dehydrogenase
MNIRAAVLEDFGEQLVVQEVELAEPNRGEALVRLVACGVCTPTSTRRQVQIRRLRAERPRHEGAGVVERVGRASRWCPPAS